MKYLEKIIIVLSIVLIALIFCASATRVSAEEKDDIRIVVSLGDSYSSGEGIEKFYGQDLPDKLKVKNRDWLAHRSELSWPGQLEIDGFDGKLKKYKVDLDNLPDDSDTSPRWYFVAASGAESQHVAKTTYRKDKDKADLTTGAVEQKKDYCYTADLISNKEDIKNGDINSLPVQISIFDKIPKGEVDYVTMTLGGNDVGFADIVMKCVTTPRIFPNSVSNELNKKLETSYMEEEQNRLIRVYKAVAKAAGPQAHIIIAGYPKLFSAVGTWGVVVNRKEAENVNNAVSIFNSKIAEAVAACHNAMMHFVPVETAFENHGAGFFDEYINPVYYKLRSQDLNKYKAKHLIKYNKDAIGSAYSVHPNKEGAKAYARVINDYIKNELKTSVTPTPTYTPTPTFTPTPTPKPSKTAIQRETFEACLDDMVNYGYIVKDGLVIESDEPDGYYDRPMYFLYTDYSIVDYDADGDLELLMSLTEYQDDHPWCIMPYTEVYEISNGVARHSVDLNFSINEDTGFCNNGIMYNYYEDHEWSFYSSKSFKTLIDYFNVALVVPDEYCEGNDNCFVVAPDLEVNDDNYYRVVFGESYGVADLGTIKKDQFEEKCKELEKRKLDAKVYNFSSYNTYHN